MGGGHRRASDASEAAHLPSFHGLGTIESQPVSPTLRYRKASAVSRVVNTASILIATIFRLVATKSHHYLLRIQLRNREKSSAAPESGTPNRCDENKDAEAVCEFSVADVNAFHATTETGIAGCSERYLVPRRLRTIPSRHPWNPASPEPQLTRAEQGLLTRILVSNYAISNPSDRPAAALNRSASTPPPAALRCRGAFRVSFLGSREVG